MQELVTNIEALMGFPALFSSFLAFGLVALYSPEELRGLRGPLVSVGLVGAMRVFPVGLQASARSRMSSRATMAAQRMLESLKLRSCEDVTEDTTTLEEFTVTTRVGEPDLPHLVDPARLKMLEATVAWTQEGRPRALTFVTYVRCSVQS